MQLVCCFSLFSILASGRSRRRSLLGRCSPTKCLADPAHGGAGAHVNCRDRAALHGLPEPVDRRIGRAAGARSANSGARTAAGRRQRQTGARFPGAARYGEFVLLRPRFPKRTHHIVAERRLPVLADRRTGISCAVSSARRRRPPSPDSFQPQAEGAKTLSAGGTDAADPPHGARRPLNANPAPPHKLFDIVISDRETRPYQVLIPPTGRCKAARPHLASTACRRTA